MMEPNRFRHIHQFGRRCFSLWVRFVFSWYVKVDIKLTRPLPAGSFILCSNHQSHLDAILLGYLGKRDYNKAAFIAAKDYWYDNRLRYHLSNLFFNLIPISRNTENGFSIRHTIEYVKSFAQGNDQCVIILPEGTRSVNGNIKKFKSGVLTLSQTSELPIVPVYIHDSGKRWPKGSQFIRPGKIQMIVGEPLAHHKIEDAEHLREIIIELSKAIK